MTGALIIDDKHSLRPVASATFLCDMVIALCSVMLLNPLAAAGEVEGHQSDGADFVEAGFVGKAEKSADRRALRAGFIKIMPSVDRVQALGVADHPGWVAASGVFIGAVNADWVGAFSTDDAEPKWWLRAPAELTAPPAVFGSWVVLGFRDGSVYKVEVLTGKIVWKAQLESFPSRTYALAGSKLLVITASQYLHALDYQTGEGKWLIDGGHPNGLTIRSLAAPVVYNNNVYFGVSTGEIICVALDTGKSRWRYAAGKSKARFQDVVGKIVIQQNRLLFSRYDGLVGAISILGEERTLLWSHKFPTIATSAYREGRFYLGGVNGDVRAIQIADGRMLWKTVTGQSVSNIRVGEQELYVSGSHGRITAMKSASGRVAWHDDVEGRVTSKPFYIGTDLYFATGNRNLYGYQTR